MAKSKSRTQIKKINNPAVSETYENTAAMQTLQQPAGVETEEPRTVVRCYVDVLDNILAKIKPVDWHQVKTAFKDEENTYVMEVVRQIMLTVDAENAPLVNHVAALHYYNGKHYVQVDETKLMCFLVEAARRCGVPDERALFQSFAKKITKQILIHSAWHNGGIAVPDTPFINLQNGTLFFEKDGYRFEPQHSPQRLIRYCLGFNYDPEATAPSWQKHLDRSLPNPAVQAYLAECLALPFYPGKIEKAPLLYGRRDTGKSTTLDVYKALIGSVNCSAATLTALTRPTDTGDYHRSQLDGKLVNIASDISTKIGDEGLAKMLISREMINVRRMRHQPFEMSNYARLIFALNEMPAKLFEDVALTKRVAIIMFEQRITESDIKTGFAEQIELKKYLLSLPDKTLLNGKKDIVKVLRGYIDRGQLNWKINERISNLRDGTVKKQTTSMTVRSFLQNEQVNSPAILTFQAPEIQQPASYDIRTLSNGRQMRRFQMETP